MTDPGLHMSMSLAASWMPWVCLAMIILVWVSCILQPRYLHGLISNSFASFTINAAEQVPSIGSQLAQWLFNSMVPAICIYRLVAQSAMYGTQLFNAILLVAILTDAFRALTAVTISYTFRLGKTANLGYMRYYSLRSLFTFIEFLLVLLLTYSTIQLPWLIILGVATLIYLFILGLQWARLFCSSLLDIISLIIYLLTIELLPTILLFEAGKQLYLSQPV